MTPTERIQSLKKWTDFMILNQEQLRAEHNYAEFPQWNKGYLECLLDLKAILESEFEL